MLIDLFKPPATVNHIHSDLQTKMNVDAIGLTQLATRDRNLTLTSLFIVKMASIDLYSSQIALRAQNPKLS